ncbi:hypothetical protein B6I21_07995 [candidate division KSB1 bacterium 4572_119]|nr:MAG: hypothetical protein B6I21_07995 [candidate division KSB1 bacterium 4572_119]
MKILIADDSKLLRDRLSQLITELPGEHITYHAKNGYEALEHIKEFKTDVVILDIRMPGGGGVEALQQIKKQPSPPFVIMFTNYPYPQYKKKCEQFGADYFFDKSNELEKLLTLLQTLDQNSFEAIGNSSI